MSTRGLSASHTFDEYQRDVEAVVEHLKLDSLVLVGVASGARLALDYAVLHPERVKAVVLIAPAGGSSSGRLFPRRAIFTLAAEDWEMFLFTIVPRDRAPADARYTVDLLQESFQQEDFMHRVRAQETARVLTFESAVELPVLVLHPRDYVIVSQEAAIEVAQRIGAQFTLLEGSSAFGDAAQGVRAIKGLLAGLPPKTTTNVPSGHDNLSARELDVLRLIAAGRSNQQIADELVISLNTVRRHVSNIFDKTGATNRVEAASYARDQGLV